MKVKERGYALKVQCRMCRKEHTLMVGVEDYLVFDMPNRPHIQDIFPYLTPAERELLISGTCGECWNKMFPPEPEFPDEEQFARMELDITWDEYLEECKSQGIPPMSFEQWKESRNNE